MTLPTSLPRATLRAPELTEPGLLGQAMLKLMAQPASVVSVRALSARLRLVTLRAEAFRSAHCAPGDKLQVRVGGLSFRAYTPLRSAATASDALELVGFLHGGATPAADWLSGLQRGDACHVRGPRASLALGALERSTVFVGDETSIGLAAALCDAPLGGLDTHFVLEVDDALDTRSALMALGRAALGRAQLVERRPGEAQLDEVEDVLARLAGADPWRQYVLSGKAQSIQRLVRSLRRAGVKPAQMLVKAYWAPGKIGLD